ncbi:MAG: bifunctional homocysteine S-methyltransferase/methylenetetrahydrofolate reductase [Desulfitobacterium hafniense]|nr:bifunctional homocysteine S-methyltransferase/methylenetetrahydrofolate reductase [Desulfitobacterium hafniense]
MDLRKHLQDHILIGDGAMATQLYQLGVPVGTCYEELCLTNPHLIRSVHEAYVSAGARLLETNTFGVNREALARYGLESKVNQINRAAVELAKEAAGDKAFVAGSIGSIIAGRVSNQVLEYYRDQYEEQASALLSGGVDGIILETFLDLEELLLAFEVVRGLTDLPIFAQLATLQVGRTRDGYTVSEAFRRLVQAGADVVGLNCRLGPAEMLRTFETSIIPEETVISVFPNAGRLGMSDGEYAYKSSPEYFAESALKFREQGVRVIGGCCGTTPEHIRQMAYALQALSPVQRVNPNVLLEEPRVEPILVRPRRNETVIELVEKRPTVLVEFDPPKDLDTESFLRGCYELHKAGADVITLADNSLANVRTSNMAVGTLMKERYGITPLLHIACRDRNLIGQQSHLMGLHALGIDQILVVTGDPSRFGDLPGSSSVFDVSSFDLIKLTKQLNQGISFSGQPLNQKADFIVGAAFNPYVRNFEAAIARLERKVASGADFIMTQPVYDEKTIRQIYESTAHINVPIFIGIMPLTSQRNAEFLHNEVPGIKLSEEALRRMKGLKGPEARREGIALSQELIDTTIKYFNGIYLITPFNYYEMTAELTKYVRSLEASTEANNIELSNS